MLLDSVRPVTQLIVLRLAWRLQRKDNFKKWKSLLLSVQYILDQFAIKYDVFSSGRKILKRDY
jgi:hypothetical protein